MAGPLRRGGQGPERPRVGSLHRLIASEGLQAFGADGVGGLAAGPLGGKPLRPPPEVFRRHEIHAIHGSGARICHMSAAAPVAGADDTVLTRVPEARS
jgi:hypothetical protein